MKQIPVWLDCDCAYERYNMPDSRKTGWGLYGPNTSENPTASSDPTFLDLSTNTLTSNNHYEFTDPFVIENNEVLVSSLAELKLEMDGLTAKTTAVGGIDCKDIKVDGDGLDLSNFKINGAFVKGLENRKLSDAPGSLPVYFEKEEIKTFLAGFNSTNFPAKTKLVLTSLSFSSDKTKATGHLLLIVPSGDSWITFGTSKFEFTTEKINFTSLELFLTEDFEMKDEFFPFTYRKSHKSDGSDGSFAKLSCEKFEGFNVQADFQFRYEMQGNGNTKMVEKLAGRKYQPLTLAFIVEDNDLNSFITQTKADGKNWRNGKQ